MIELVTPDGPNSKLANALKKGGGLNHLCYLSPAIDDECRRLRESGMSAAAIAGRGAGVFRPAHCLADGTRRHSRSNWWNPERDDV